MRRLVLLIVLSASPAHAQSAGDKAFDPRTVRAFQAGHARGNFTVNVVPLSVDSTPIVPLWATTID